MKQITQEELNSIRKSGSIKNVYYARTKFLKSASKDEVGEIYFSGNELCFKNESMDKILIEVNYHQVLPYLFHNKPAKIIW